MAVGMAALALSARPVSVDKKYPRISEIEGDVYDLSQAGQKKLKKSDRIFEAFHPVTKENSRLRLEINPHLIVDIWPETDLNLPAISWETRAVSALHLIQGLIQIQVTKSEPFLKVKSDLFESALPVGEYVFELNKNAAQITVYVLRGQIQFGALNADEKQTLNAGQKATFTGVLEEGEIQQDLLLKGRKIPKGVLGAVENLTEAEVKKFSKEELKRKQMLKKIAEEKKTANHEAKRLGLGLLCHAPQGTMNQCVWRLEKDKCIRRRCTADGIWKDPQEVGMSNCQNKAQAQLCDY